MIRIEYISIIWFMNEYGLIIVLVHLYDLLRKSYHYIDMNFETILMIFSRWVRLK